MKLRPCFFPVLEKKVLYLCPQTEEHGNRVGWTNQIVRIMKVCGFALAADADYLKSIPLVCIAFEF